MAPLLAEELSAGDRVMHLVLEAGRCYRVVAVGDVAVDLELRDEHDQALAERAGRVVRFEGVCPRWTSSFELRIRLDGPRGRVALYEDEASPAGAGPAPTSSMAR
ncbi:MAG: hypothetical protein R3B82_01860 [Sandaracinaceae bacterium]